MVMPSIVQKSSSVEVQGTSEDHVSDHLASRTFIKEISEIDFRLSPSSSGLCRRRLQADEISADVSSLTAVINKGFIDRNST